LNLFHHSSPELQLKRVNLGLELK